MGKITGFLEIPREMPARRPVADRLKDWRELEGKLPEEKLQQQGAPQGPEADAEMGPNEESWPYVPYPHHDQVNFENSGYTYPEYVEPNKELYVEPDEAEAAKKKLWNRLKRGGRKS